MKKITTLLLALFSFTMLFSQITNGGFEDWSLLPTFEHPDMSPAAFVSINNEIFYDSGLLGCTEVTGTEGSAVKIETQDNDGDLAIGYGITGNTPEGEELVFSGGFPFTDMNVTGFSVDLRYDISLLSPGFIIVQFLASGVPVTGGPEGNGTYIVPLFGTQATFVNNTYSFTGDPLTQVPDECIVAFACNDVINETGFEGNYLELDNFVFTGTSEVMPGGDFNTWVEVEAGITPDSWQTFLPWAFDWWEQSSMSYEGDYSLALKTLELENGDTVQGFMYQAEIFDDGFFPNQPLEFNSTALEFYYQFEGMPDDSATVYFIVSEFENPLPEEMAFFVEHLGPTDDWTQHTIDFSFIPNMNYYGIIFASGMGFDEAPIPGAILNIDALAILTGGDCEFTPTITEGDVTLCEGEDSELTTQVYDTYSWYGSENGDIFEIFSEDAVIPLFEAEEGVYEVYLAATLDGCTAISEIITIEVLGVPEPNVSVNGGGATEICDGESVDIIVENADEFETYQWHLLGFDIPGATTDTYTAVGVLDLTSTFSVTVTTAECPDVEVVSGGIIIISHSNPNPTISQSGNTLSTGSGFETYQWFLDGVEIDGATSASYDFTEDGDYSVFVTNEWDCEGESDDFAAVFTSVIEFEDVIINLYPNPVQDLLNIQIDKGSINGITITDLSGKVIVNEVITESELYTLDVSKMSMGLYLIQLQTSNGIITKRITIL